MFQSFLLGLGLFALFCALYMLVRNDQAYRAGSNAISAISKYNQELINNNPGGWDIGLYDKALVPYQERLFGNIFKFDRMLAIRDEYKELLEPYFED